MNTKRTPKLMNGKFCLLYTIKPTLIRRGFRVNNGYKFAFHLGYSFMYNDYIPSIGRYYYNTLRIPNKFSLWLK